MPFMQDDLYLNRGTDKLARGDWKGTVYKYDASSFYNWEQDNLPLYDLEERTELNWEQHGYPTSSLTGLSLVVSDSGVDTTGPYRVFGSVSAVLEKLPKVLRFPVVVEIAASGDLGNIDVTDFEFVGTGGLELVNRGFGKILAGSAAGDGDAIRWDIKASGAGTSSIHALSSIDLSNTLNDSSALGVSTSIETGRADFWNGYHRSIIRMADVFRTGDIAQTNYGTAIHDRGATDVKDLRNNGITVTIAANGFLDNIANKFILSQYQDQTSGLDYDHGSYLTTKALRPSDMSNLQNAATTDEKPTGSVYANSARRITVKNCNGPLYIRGFIVDGYRGTNAPTGDITHEIKNGIEVENSNVVLENCAAIRCANTGLKVTNSDVTLNRGFTSYRIYPMTNSVRGTAESYGLQANNSNITLSAALDVSAGLPIDAPYSFAHCPIGVHLNNSVLKTPQGGRGKNLSGTGVTTAESPFQQVYLDTFLNTSAGLVANDSTIDFNHTIMSYMNEVGIKLNNTTMKVDELVCDHNNWCGLKGKNSTIEYYKNLHGITTSPNKVLSFIYNGQHLNLENCVFKNKDFGIFATAVQNAFEIGSGGYQSRNGITVPGVVLKGTKADFLQMKTLSGAHVGFTYKTGSPVLGEAYYIDEGSDVRFLGTSGSFYTRLEGPGADLDQLLDSVAVYVDNNSKVEFNGPTVINQAGINVGANNNSSMRFAPHNREGRLNVSGFALSDTNQHTRVHLQSFKACLAADNGSTIEMKDCGDFNQTWINSADSYVAAADTGLIAISDYNASNANSTTLYTSGGYVQFYPNPVVRGGDAETPAAVANTVSSLNPASILGSDNQPDFSKRADYNTYSWGGVCVRADKGSEVNVLNTHFPCGWLNASAIVLDVSAGSHRNDDTTNCSQLYIWNIGDDSSLHASQISVSGLYPGDTGYHGPSGLYVSAAGSCFEPNIALSSVPSATPHTGRLSILDSFGKHPQYALEDGAAVAEGAMPLGARTTFENKGPFRIYFSVKPIAKYLGYPRCGGGADQKAFTTVQLSSNLDAGYAWPNTPSATELGEPYQELAQGYNPSRDCSTIDPTTVSSIYNELGFQTAASDSGQPLSTTFFYASAMLDDSYVNRIWLDDSAMNTFANAKNATKGTSGRVKLVSYYRATTAKYGESYTGEWGNTTEGIRKGYGLGFRSSNIFDFNRDT